MAAWLKRFIEGVGEIDPASEKEGVRHIMMSRREAYEVWANENNMPRKDGNAYKTFCRALDEDVMPELQEKGAPVRWDSSQPILKCETCTSFLTQLQHLRDSGSTEAFKAVHEAKMRHIQASRKEREFLYSLRLRSESDPAVVCISIDAMDQAKTDVPCSYHAAIGESAARAVTGPSCSAEAFDRHEQAIAANGQGVDVLDG